MAKEFHKGITPAAVAEAAFNIVEADGADALTMRRLGAELGVAAMAIYNHFPDREAILDAVAERALAGLLDGPMPAVWKARLRRIITAVHTLADAHPRVFAVVATRPNRPRAFFPIMAESLDALRSAGLGRAAAVRWYHTFLMLIHGYAAWRATLERYANAAAKVATVAREGDGLSAEELADFQAVHSVSPRAQFDHAVEQLLGALETEIES